MYRSILALALAALFVMSSASAQYPIQPLEVHNFSDFVRAMLLAAPTIVWKYTTIIASFLCMPCWLYVDGFVGVITFKGFINNILNVIGSIFAPILISCMLPAWFAFLLISPILLITFVFRVTSAYFTPLAFPGRLGNTIDLIIALVLLPFMIIPALISALCTLPLSIPLTIISLLLAVVLSPLWFPIQLGLLLFAIILRTQYQGAGLFLESIRTRAEDLVKDTTESCLIRIFPSLNF